MSIIGQQIKKYRMENGLTQEQVGRMIGVTTQAVSKWERGSTPDLQRRTAFCSSTNPLRRPRSPKDYDVVKAMRSLGARTIFNTHMHELAMNLDKINAPDGKIKVASLVTGIHEGRRSYKVYCAPPDGISYARDIAEKYGVTYSQLMKMTVERRS